MIAVPLAGGGATVPHGAPAGGCCTGVPGCDCCCCCCCCACCLAGAGAAVYRLKAINDEITRIKSLTMQCPLY